MATLQVICKEDDGTYWLDYKLDTGEKGRFRIHARPLDVKAGLPDKIVEAGEAETK